MRIKPGITAIILIAGLCLTMQVFAQSAASPQTKAFVSQASIGNQFEIETGQLALRMSVTPEIRYFAQMMVTEHTHLGQQMTNTLASADVMLTPPVALDDRHQKMLDLLKTDLTENFDSHYIRLQTTAHADAISLFRNYANNGDQVDLRNFASDTLPMLEQHQQMLYNLVNLQASAPFSGTPLAAGTLDKAAKGGKP